MKIKPKQYAISLYEAVKNISSGETKSVLSNFVKVLAKNNALKMAPQIIEYFLNYANRMEGIADLKIKTALPAEEKMIEEIKKFAPDLLGKKFKKINVQKEVDSKLLGGFVFEYEDMVFDASVKNKLKILKNNLLTK